VAVDELRTAMQKGGGSNGLMTVTTSERDRTSMKGSHASRAYLARVV
jgi:hypothetical protein